MKNIRLIYTNILKYTQYVQIYSNIGGGKASISGNQK